MLVNGQCCILSNCKSGCTPWGSLIVEVWFAVRATFTPWSWGERELSLITLYYCHLVLCLQLTNDPSGVIIMMTTPSPPRGKWKSRQRLLNMFWHTPWLRLIWKTSDVFERKRSAGSGSSPDMRLAEMELCQICSVGNFPTESQSAGVLGHLPAQTLDDSEANGLWGNSRSDTGAPTLFQKVV